MRLKDFYRKLSKTGHDEPAISVQEPQRPVSNGKENGYGGFRDGDKQMFELCTGDLFRTLIHRYTLTLPPSPSLPLSSLSSDSRGLSRRDSSSSSSSRPIGPSTSRSEGADVDYYADFEKASKDTSLNESNLGMSMLKNMGWTSGTGLGADR